MVFIFFVIQNKEVKLMADDKNTIKYTIEVENKATDAIKEITDNVKSATTEVNKLQKTIGDAVKSTSSNKLSIDIDIDKIEDVEKELVKVRKAIELINAGREVKVSEKGIIAKDELDTLLVYQSVLEDIITKTKEININNSIKRDEDIAKTQSAIAKKWYDMREDQLGKSRAYDMAKQIADAERQSKNFAAALKKDIEERDKQENERLAKIKKAVGEVRKANERNHEAELKRRKDLNEAVRSYATEILRAETLVNAGRRASNTFYATSIANCEKYRQKIKELGGDVSKLKANPLENADDSMLQIDRTMSKTVITWNNIKNGLRRAKGFFQEVSASLSSFESQTSKVKQNLELNDIYKGTNGATKLTEDLKRLQEASIQFAIMYGEKIEDVAESFSILSRRFKDPDTLIYLENLAIQIARLDNIKLQTVSTDLEAIILQMGLSAEQVKDFVNLSAVAVHSTRITGQELLAAMKRSGSAFKATKADLKETIALISTLSTATGREGGTIGNVFRGMLSYEMKDSKKIDEAFKLLGVDRYLQDVEEQADETDGSVRMVFKNQGKLIEDIFTGYNKLDDKQKNMVVSALSGGVYRINEARVLFEESQKTYMEIKEKLNNASDETTQALLVTSLSNYSTMVDRLNTSFSSLKLQLGESLMPIMRDFIEYITYATVYIIDHKEEVRKWIDALVPLVGGIALVGTTWGVVSHFILDKNSLINKSFSLLVSFFEKTIRRSVELADTTSTVASALNNVGNAGAIAGEGAKKAAVGINVAREAAIMAIASMVALAGAMALVAGMQYTINENTGANNARKQYKNLNKIKSLHEMESRVNSNAMINEKEGAQLQDKLKEEYNRGNGLVIYDEEAGLYKTNYTEQHEQQLLNAKKIIDDEEAEVEKEAEERAKRLAKAFKRPEFDMGKVNIGTTGYDKQNQDNMVPATQPTGGGKGSGSSTGGGKSAWRENEYQRFKYLQQLNKERYDNIKAEIEAERKLYGNNHRIGDSINNEVKWLKDLEAAMNNANAEYEDNEKRIKEFISGNKEIISALKAEGVEWDNLSQKEKESLAKRTNDENFKEIVRQADEARKSVAKLTLEYKKQAVTIRQLREDAKSPTDKFKEEREQIERDYTSNKYRQYGFETHENKEQREIQYIQSLSDERNRLQEDLDNYLREVAEGNAELNKAKIEEIKNQLQDLDNKIKEHREKLSEYENKAVQELNNGMKSTFSDMLLEGKSFAEGWKSLWKNIAKIALDAIWKIYVEKAILGIFGGGLAGGGEIGLPKGTTMSGWKNSGALSGVNLRLATGGNIPGYANGGQYIQGAGTGKSDSILAYVANKDKFVFLSNGEYVMTAEATKRIGKRNLDAMNYGYAEGGMINPVPYVPSINPVVASKAMNITPHSRTEELLMQQNKQMAEQLSLMRNMGGSGDSRMVILNTQASSTEVIKAMQDNPRAVQALLGRQNRMGFR